MHGIMLTPNIKLLRSPFGWYFFDVNCNEILSIDSDVYCLLEKVVEESMTLENAMDPEIIEFCLAHKIAVLISVDGPKEIHDKNRRLAYGDGSTFDLVVHNLQEARRHYPEFLRQIMINMVVDPTNDVDCANRLFIEHDIFSRDQSTANILDTTFTTESYDATEEFRTKDGYHQFLAFMHHFGRVHKDRVSPFSRAMLNQATNERERMMSSLFLPDAMGPGGPCLPGVMRTFVDIHGNFFPCERCSELASVMCIGSLDKGFDLDRARAILNIGALTEEECRNCWAISKCLLCAAQVEDGDSFSASKKLTKCSQIRSLAELDLQNLIMLSEVEYNLHRKGETVARN